MQQAGLLTRSAAFPRPDRGVGPSDQGPADRPMPITKPMQEDSNPATREDKTVMPEGTTWFRWRLQTKLCHLEGQRGPPG